MSDSEDSAYEVEHFVRPDRIRRTVNDDTADLLGNFDDAIRKEIFEGHFLNPPENTREESEEEEIFDFNDKHVNTEKNTDETNQSDVPQANGDENSADDGESSKMLSKDQLDMLLRGVSKANRHVLYVTNINNETTKEDLFRHFEKAGTVKSVRMPKKRRCAFVEFTDMESYQRGFTLHNTELRNRQIKVQYSEAGKKKSANKKNIIKQKNRKLAQMRNELKTFTKSGKFYDKNLKKEKAVEALARKRWRKKPAAPRS